MRVLLAGGNGFIGSRVVRELVRCGHEARCLLRPGARTGRLAGTPYGRVEGDVLDAASLRAGMHGCEAAIHLAYPTSWDTLNAPDLRDLAVVGTRNFLVAARQSAVRRVLYVSSIAAVGGTRSPKMHDETAPYTLLPRRALRYSHFKHHAEQLCRQAAAEGQDVVVVNPAEVYGPEDVDLVTASNLLDVLGRDPVLVTRGGTCVAHVDDVAGGIVLALEHGRAGERYILGGENVTLERMARICLEATALERRVLVLPPALLSGVARVARVLRLPLPVNPEVVPYATRYWYMDAEKARRELGARFRPARATLRSCLQWLGEAGRLPRGVTLAR